MTAFRDGGYDTGVALTDLAAYVVVKRNSDDKVVLATAGTDAIVGVVEKPGKQDALVSYARVNGQGSFKVRTGAAVAKGDELTADAAGTAVVATPGDRVFGVARADAAEHDVVEYEKADRVAA
ncbi:hypothetical protein [Tsukamurella spumae]|uniref:DUF2190 family protein n=1 Tax=Tsukamurella spumae TaxID=44753 RepID=A0A846X2S5_9ACTN|nr:hypothetical protein [Tsukamurella spumae]NKY18866.1 hypothetical protein [Tsukamurella spumae]